MFKGLILPFVNPHIEELKQWYEGKKEAIKASIMKYWPGKEKKK